MATAGSTVTREREPRSDDASPHGWVARPWAARAIRWTAMAVPVGLSFLASFVVTGLLPPTSSVTGTLGRWACVIVVSLGVFVVAERWFRRLLPLSSLFTMSLAFPDRTPSRFRLGLRTATTSELRRRTDDAAERADETVDDAARRLLELVARLNSHDRVTRGHSERVRAYSHMIGTEMGLRGRDLERLTWSALLHDIGKIRVPGRILNKAGRLTDDEFAVITTHPDEGRRLVEPLQEWLGESLSAVWQHHERMDGTGYPAGLAGDEISLAGRIVCVADAYDVMTAVRSYKAPMTAEAARAELIRCAGTQFDPEVVRAFLRASIDDRAWRGLAGLSFLPLFGRALIAPLASGQGAAALGALALVSGVVAAADPTPIVDALRLPPSSTVESTSDEGDETDGTDMDDDGSSVDDGDRATGDRPATLSSDRETQGPDDDRRDAGRRAGPDDDPDAAGDPGGVTTTPRRTPATNGPDGGPVPGVGTTPVTTPRGTVPSVTTPPTSPPTEPTDGGAGPGVTTPAVTVPSSSGSVDVSTPVVSVSVTVPPVTLPDLSVPPVVLPPLTVPTVTVPPVTVPPLTVPVVNVPVSVPPVSPPPITVPKVTLSPVTVPSIEVVVSIPGSGGLGLVGD